MSGTRFIGVAVLAGASMLALTLSVSAFAQSQATRTTRSSPPASAAGQAVTPLDQIRPAVKPTVLKPIQVLGRKIYLPQAFHMIRAALKRPVSFAPRDMDKLVCRRGNSIGSYIPTLRCATNCQRWVTQEATQLMLTTGTTGAFSTQMCDGPNGTASPTPSTRYRKAEIVAAAVAHADARGSASALLGLIWKLESAGPSYTLEITDHGKVAAKYVLKDGKVVKVWKANNDGND